MNTQRRLAAVAALFTVSILAAGARLAAQAAAPPSELQPPQRPAVTTAAPPASAAQGEFVPLKELPAAQGQEHLPAAPLVMGAYAFVWLALLIYVWVLWRRMTAVQKELADLKRQSERKA